jgi:hypothetical protein
MTETQKSQFFQRIDQVRGDEQPKFGQMNVRQMICHCADELRMAMGIKKALEYGGVDPAEITLLARSRQTVPAPRGFGQVEGEGTAPTSLENDRRILKDLINQYLALPDTFQFPPHPYFGEYNRQQWDNLTVYHLNHHLSQFGL